MLRFALQGNTLRLQLFRSYLAQMAIFIFAVLFLASLFFIAANRTKQYVNAVIPQETAVYEIVANINLTILLLNHWVREPREQDRLKRQHAWQRIRENFKTLQSLSGEDKHEFGPIGKKLKVFEAQQWIIEDLAHMPGNAAAVDIYNRKILHLKNAVINAFYAYEESISSRKLSGRQRLSIGLLLSKLKLSFYSSDSSLLSFIYTEEPLLLDQYSRSHSETGQLTVEVRRLQSRQSKEGLHLLGELERNLKLYQEMSEDIVRLSGTPQWNLSDYKIKTDLIPLGETIGRELNLLLSEKNAEVNAYSDFVLNISRGLGLLTLFLIVVLLYIAVYLSRRKSSQITTPLAQLDAAAKQVARQQHLMDIEIQGCDEVVSLAQTFNIMKQELEVGRQSLVDLVHKAETASRSKSIFLSSMSHEFRTPLNAIIGFNQLIVEENARRMSKTLQDFHDEIEYAAEEMLRMVEASLEMASMDEKDLHPELVFPEQVFAAVANKYKNLAEKKGIRVLMPLKQDICASIVTDRRFLESILSNLVENAIVHNDAGCEVRLGSRHSERGITVLEVSDNGGGFSQDQLKRVFQPFEKLGKEGLGDRGLGLGLALSRRFAELIEARLELHSLPGEGSTFSLYLNPNVSPDKSQITVD